MAAVMISTHLHAQQDSSIKSMDEAVVTATKFEQKQSQTGKVVTIISKQQLEKSNKTLFSDIFSFSNSRTSINGRNSLYSH